MGTKSNENTDVLRISTLSSFCVTRGDEDLTLQNRLAKKPWLVLKYLIANRGRIVSKERLAEIVEPEEYDGDTDRLINNLIYRLRKILGEKSGDDEGNSCSVLFENGGYKWNKTGYNALDLDIVDDHYSKLWSRNHTEEEHIGFCDRIIDLYDYDFLPENEKDQWTQSTRTHYHNIFIRTVMEKISYLSFNSEYPAILSLCEKVFDIDYYNVDIHVEYLKAHIQMGNMRAALSHYEESTEKLYTQAGISPSPVMVGLYKTIKQNNGVALFSFSDIHKHMVENMQHEGALVCDPMTFSFIYNLEKNRDSRFDQSVYIVLLSFIHREGVISDENMLKKEMKGLEQILVKSLRGTDLISRWSTSQFLLLLYRMPSEHMDTVLKRIENSYSAQDNELSLIKSYKRI
jgi:DNA-binding SARP family transcriptional activator